MLDRAIAFVGIALTVIFTFLIYLVPKMPAWVAQSGIGVGLLILGLGAGMIYADHRNEDSEQSEIRTALRLQFHGGTKTPTTITLSNIRFWYALWSESATFTEYDTNGKLVVEHRIPEKWTLFVLFTKPTKYTQLTVSFDSPGFPPYEIKNTGDRWAIIHMGGEIPIGALEVYAKP